MLASFTADHSSAACWITTIEQPREALFENADITATMAGPGSVEFV